MRKNWILSLALMGMFGTATIAGTETRAGDNWTDHSPTSYYAQGSLASHVTDAGPCATAAPMGGCAGIDCGPVWVVGTEFTFLGANLRNNSSTNIQYENAGVPGSSASIAGGGGYEDFTYAPRIVLGRQGQEWGLIGRFWYLSDSNDHTSPVLGPGQDGLGGFERLEAYTVDLEITRQFLRMNGGRTVFSGGVRYASLESGAGINATALPGGDLVNAYSVSNSSIRGTGLTFGVIDTRPIGDCGWFLFSGARGSVLWGDSTARAATGAVANSFGAVGASFNEAEARSSDEALFIGEAMLGLQYERQLRCAPATAYVRIAGEFQWWTGGDVGAAAFSGATANNTGVLANAFAGDTDMTLTGFSVGAGLTW